MKFYNCRWNQLSKSESTHHVYYTFQHCWLPSTRSVCLSLMDWFSWCLSRLLGTMFFPAGKVISVCLIQYLKTGVYLTQLYALSTSAWGSVRAQQKLPLQLGWLNQLCLCLHHCAKSPASPISPFSKLPVSHYGLTQSSPVFSSLYSVSGRESLN